jgi:molecular chaperone GrpE
MLEMSKKPYENSNSNSGNHSSGHSNSSTDQNGRDQSDLSKHRLDQEGVSGEDVTSLGGAGDNVQNLKPDLNSVDHWRAEAEKFKNEYLYLLAEFDNYKKNVIKERSDLRKYGSERLIVEVLGGLDLLDRALEAQVNAENIESFRKGIELTSSQLKSSLQKFGVEELPAQGAQFDPSMHEALSSEESSTIAAGFISQVFRKPYKLYERVVRPGQVVVARAPSQNKPE